MKILRRYFLITLTSILAVTLTSCNIKTSSNPEAIINKTIENIKNIKSGESTAVITAEMVTNNDTPKVETKLTTIFTKNPSVYKINSVVTSSNSTDGIYSEELYLKDDTSYLKKGTSSEWTKSSYSAVTSQYEHLKNNVFPEKILEAYKKSAIDFKVTEENGNYVLTYTGTDKEKFKEVIISILNSSKNFDDQNDIYNNIDPKELQIKYVVTKDYTPVSSETKFSFGSNNLTFIGTININYNKLNSINEINLPDETKNAVEISG